MSGMTTQGNFNWICTGEEIFPAMLAAIDAARRSVCLETYTYQADELGLRFRDALVRARQRSVRVRVLIDGLGSAELPSGFFQPLIAAGGEMREFNPWKLKRLGIRNHRKLLVCDETVAFIGGFNITSEFQGDGVTRGWCDIGLKIEGPLVAELAETFDDMEARADFLHKRFIRLRQLEAKRTVSGPNEQLLLSGPGRGRSPIKHALRLDLAQAASVRIMVAYFLPTWRLRRAIVNVALRGGTVELLLAGRSDVAISQLAGQSLYRRFLKTSVRIYEYQPQILHAKLFIIDDKVYVGSANLDQRSLNINYELMVRLQNKDMAARALEIFQTNLKHSQEITIESWTRSRTLWRRIKQRWAYFVLVRLDPFIANRQWRAIPD
jgi:cardiolipin synthase